MTTNKANTVKRLLMQMETWLSLKRAKRIYVSVSRGWKTQNLLDSEGSWEHVGRGMQFLLENVGRQWVPLYQQTASVLPYAVATYFILLQRNVPNGCIQPDHHDLDGWKRKLSCDTFYVQIVCKVFETAVKQTEKDDFTLCELFPVMR
jgi:hypothetical protein